MNFREASLDDCDFVFECLVELAAHEGQPEALKLSKDALREILSAGGAGTDFIILEVDHQPSGVAILCERFSPYSGGINWFLVDLYLKACVRGQGMGGLFMNHLKLLAKQRGYVLLEWFVDSQNDAAKQFYVRQGGERKMRSEHWSLAL